MIKISLGNKTVSQSDFNFANFTLFSREGDVQSYRFTMQVAIAISKELALLLRDSLTSEDTIVVQRVIEDEETVPYLNNGKLVSYFEDGMQNTVNIEILGDFEVI